MCGHGAGYHRHSPQSACRRVTSLGIPLYREAEIARETRRHPTPRPQPPSQERHRAWTRRRPHRPRAHPADPEVRSRPHHLQHARRRCGALRDEDAHRQGAPLRGAHVVGDREGVWGDPGRARAAAGGPGAAEVPRRRVRLRRRARRRLVPRSPLLLLRVRRTPLPRGVALGALAALDPGNGHQHVRDERRQDPRAARAHARRRVDPRGGLPVDPAPALRQGVATRVA